MTVHVIVLFVVFCFDVDCLFLDILGISLLWALKVFKQLNLSPEVHLTLCDEKGDVDRVKRPWEIISAGHKIGIPQPLFKELVYIMSFR